jgi:hypothetical protein
MSVLHNFEVILLLKMIKELLVGCTHDIVDFIDLVQLVLPWEEGEQRQNLEKHTPCTPYVHLIAIVSVCKQAFRRPVPPSRYVLGEGWLAVQASATTQICQLHCVTHYQNVFTIEIVD